ncbi:MAG: phenylalanine--tRNA ligase subunit beta [Zetaproteobacteria bacterium CG2_30_46_52]|nr:MAG: phenylalanine--tRNA ligase subunit beta [Zetaproteobacteria bacterium CG2_30_46_52]
MKIPFSWLKEHVQLTKAPKDIADDLVRLGHEVESIALPQAGVLGVRIGQILDMKPHPDADKLKLLKLDLGEAEPLAIVCGASNMKQGDKVPVATVGTNLPNGLTIKQGKIRGEVSFGMCCSVAELGLAEDADGLLILPTDAPVGMEVGAYLELEEAVLDLDITPNRGDCMSARGLARDLAADGNLPLIAPDEEPADVSDSVAVPSVQVTASNDCPLYMARRIEGVAVSDAPDWIKARLLAAGQRSINGVVDIINYTMLDLGQPMHAFDADKLTGGLHVRATVEGESFLALDGREITLHAGNIVIADDKAVVALAGIMGSEHTGVTETTTNIVLESAAFRAALISTTRRTHGLVSESSMRFERGVDPEMIAVAMNQATLLILELFGGSASEVITIGDADTLVKHKVVNTSIARIESRLGLTIPESADDVLNRMGFVVTRKEGLLEVEVPSHRHDVSLAEDISEEYARVIGFDAIPEVLPSLATIKPHAVDTAMSSATAAGFVQVINYAFISPAEQRLFTAADDKDLVLQNPISDAMSVMRRSVWPGLLNTAKHNMNRQQAGVMLVEQGRVYEKFDTEKNKETNVIAWLMTGQIQADAWYAKANKADFFDLKGAVEAWLENRGLVARFMAEENKLGLQAGQCAKIFVGKAVVGFIGKVDTDIASNFDLASDVFVAEINLDVLNAGKKAKFQPIPEFPSVERDLVFLFDKKHSSEAILQEVRKAGGQTLVEAGIFDRYIGKGVPEGFVSLGIRFVLQDAKRTLTQDDSDAAMKSIIKAMADKFAAELRG